MATKYKTAILLTGAAARISQEVALFDQLRAQKSLTVSPDDTLLVGFSSGSLNLAAINACFTKGSKLDWDKYYKQTVLFPLKNSDVYKIDGIPFDTTPLRNTIQKFVDTMGCKNVGDLGFHSYIITFSWRELKTLWACSRVEGQQYINLTDMFMSSTAIPVAFPWQEIHCETGHTMDFPKGHFADGGTHGTFDNFDEYLGKYVKTNGQFENMYIISPMREKSEDGHEEAVSIVKNNTSSADDISKFIDHLKHISMNGFLDFLQKLNSWNYKGSAIAKNIYISIPEMASNFPIIDFDQEEKQYNAVTDWVSQNPEKLAIPIDQFLKTHHKV
ncbi:MAG TPA: hypothetical protein DIW31_03455 [Bacteroidales bacterium]|nr:hypothetical protein [Bacteroidales bacterium]